MARKLHRQSGMFPDPGHIFPEGDRFYHSKSPACPCIPLAKSDYVPGIGGVVWLEHRLVDPVEVLVPDTLPEEWQ